MNSNILIDWLVMTIAILIAAYVMPGVAVSGFLAAVIVALVLGILNAFIKPLLLFLTLPINVLTLGLFTIVINAILILITSAIVPGFRVAGFWTAVIFSIVLAIVLYIIHLVSGQKTPVV